MRRLRFVTWVAICCGPFGLMIALTGLISDGFSLWDDPAEVRNRDLFAAKIEVLSAELRLTSLQGKTLERFQKREAFQEFHRELSGLREQAHYKWLATNEGGHEAIGLLTTCLELSRTEETIQDTELQENIDKITMLLDRLQKMLTLPEEENRANVFVVNWVVLFLMTIGLLGFLALD